VLVGYEGGDDAGVFRVRADYALVQTVDFFTPIVDDPFDFGRIAATNALSDVYAMGGTPLTALNIVAFPVKALGTALLARVLEGGATVAKEAGVAILGGHTVEDDEPKYGMAVTGRVHPDKVVTNAGARPGDALVLTKPIGTGVLASALKKGAIDETQMAEAIGWMTTLNAAASKAMLAAGAHAATDVTGYGLLGHAHEIARASGVRVRLRASAVPLLGLARDLASVGIVPGGSRNNAREHEAFTEFARGVPGDVRALLSDAQTSGGLLICAPAERSDELCAALRACGALGAVVGSVETGHEIAVDA
jgi:selenide,water dikinase